MQAASSLILPIFQHLLSVKLAELCWLLTGDAKVDPPNQSRFLQSSFRKGSSWRWAGHLRNVSWQSGKKWRRKGYVFTCFSAFYWGHSSSRAGVAQQGYSPRSRFISAVSFFLCIDLAITPGSCQCCFSACFLFLPSNFYSWSINFPAAAVWDVQ